MKGLRMPKKRVKKTNDPDLDAWVRLAVGTSEDDRDPVAPISQMLGVLSTPRQEPSAD